MYAHLNNNDTNLKGEVGEIIAKYYLKEAIFTKQFHHTFLNRFNLEKEKLDFLVRNWKSFDLVDPVSSTIYEVKTRNFFNRKLKGIQNKVVITPNFIELYERATSLGFSMKVVDITFFSDWKYGIIIREFDKSAFWVHRPRPSGWERQRRRNNTS